MDPAAVDPDTLKVIVGGVVSVGAGMAAVVRWGVVRITKSIDEAAAAQTLAAERAAAAQLAAAEKYAAAAQAQAVAFEVLRGDLRAVSEYIHDQPSARAAGSGRREFKPG